MLRQLATKQHIEGFSKVWKYNGVDIILTDTHYQFALDFANMILNSFIEQQAIAAKLSAQKAQPKLITEAI